MYVLNVLKAIVLEQSAWIRKIETPTDVIGATM